MKNYLDEFSMRQASIFELRSLARDMGVNSPTTLKKEELIDKIIKITRGEEKPQMPKSRQGRPPKKIHTQYSEDQSIDFLKGLTEKDFINLSKKKDFDNTSFNSSWVLACPNTFSLESSNEDSSFSYEEREGYLKVMEEDGSGFIFQTGRCANADTAIYVAPKTIIENNLKSGDLINCVCKKILSNETRYLAEIKAVNKILFRDYKKQNRLNFDLIKICANNEISLFDNVQEESVLSSLKQGCRNIIKTKNLKEYFNILKNIISQNQGYSVVNLCLEVLPEEEGLFEFGANFEQFYTVYGDSAKQNNITIDLAIERVKRICEQNNSVVFVINDLGKLIKFQNFALENEAYDIKYKSLNNVYKVLNLARVFENNNITVVSLFKDNVFYQNLFKIEEELENFNCNIINLK